MKAARLFKLLLALALVSLIAVPAVAAEFTIKVGTIVSESHPDYICMRDVFKKYVESESNGKIKVEIYPNAQLGGDRELSDWSDGDDPDALPATSAIAGFEKRFQVLDFPSFSRAGNPHSKHWTANSARSSILI
jgi:TRAP-type C4-dicarboxylate transport system substrate-binding protein